MTQRMQKLAGEIVRLQRELDREIEKCRKILGWKMKDRIVQFERGVTAEHRRLRKSTRSFLRNSSIWSIVTAPMFMLDGSVSFYQTICFRVYQIPRVTRAQYIVFDRQHLSYLNWIETLNCAYCGYANGLVAYVREIGSHTEQYWCPIKHAFKIDDPRHRYCEFLEYGDTDSYRAARSVS